MNRLLSSSLPRRPSPPPENHHRPLSPRNGLARTIQPLRKQLQWRKKSRLLQTTSGFLVTRLSTQRASHLSLDPRQTLFTPSSSRPTITLRPCGPAIFDLCQTSERRTVRQQLQHQQHLRPLDWFHQRARQYILKRRRQPSKMVK
ncbi:hypothetical protein LB505_001610 [Fusarium chuoi]|nr:hypothetical protein LB505_001610 [Fusarium chuoi]